MRSFLLLYYHYLLLDFPICHETEEEKVSRRREVVVSTQKMIHSPVRCYQLFSRGVHNFFLLKLLFLRFFSPDRAAIVLLILKDLGTKRRLL